MTLTWLKAYGSGARANPIMGAIASKMSEADMKAASEYIAGLR
jgi:cytochrome c553